MRKRPTLYIVIILTFSLLAANVFIPEKAESWRTETLYSGEGPAKFVQIEQKNGEPVVAFSSDNGVELYRRTGSDLPLIDAYQDYTDQKTWEKTLIDSNGSTGSYLSMKKIDDKIAMSYQDSSIGDEKLFFIQKTNQTWKRERVDWVGGTGLGTGMYSSLTSLNQQPVIFYHTSEGSKFVKAEKTGQEWNQDVIDTGTGWFTSTDTCGKKIFVLYRQRDTQNLNIGEYSDSSGWETRSINARTDGMTAIDATKCSIRSTYNDIESGNIQYREQNTTETVGEGKLSRVSLAYNNNPHISYYLKGKGLIYTEKQSKWEASNIDSRTYAGRYNDIEIIDQKPSIAYTKNGEVLYTEYNSNGYQEIKTYLESTNIILAAVSIIGILTFYRNKILTNITNHTG